jgi:hypothetical protein
MPTIEILSAPRTAPRHLHSIATRQRAFGTPVQIAPTEFSIDRTLADATATWAVTADVFTSLLNDQSTALCGIFLSLEEAIVETRKLWVLFDSGALHHSLHPSSAATGTQPEQISDDSEEVALDVAFRQLMTRREDLSGEEGTAATQERPRTRYRFLRR